MDRGSSEEGVDDLLRLVYCTLIMSYLGSAILLSALASTFTSVALIHSYLLSSELLNSGELPSDGSQERYRLIDLSAVSGFCGIRNLGNARSGADRGNRMG